MEFPSTSNLVSSARGVSTKSPLGRAIARAESFFAQSRQARGFPLHVRQGVSLSMSFRAKRGTSSFLIKDEMLRFAQHDRMEDVPPSASEGSLGTCAPREDAVGNVAPSPPFFVAPRRQPRGLPGDAVPNEVMRDAVPSEARDASLSLGMTKNGGSAGQGGVSMIRVPLCYY